MIIDRRENQPGMQKSSASKTSELLDLALKSAGKFYCTIMFLFVNFVPISDPIHRLLEARRELLQPQVASPGLDRNIRRGLNLMFDPEATNSWKILYQHQVELGSYL